jgi:hypothetical protein
VPTTDAILNHVRSLGFAVNVHRMGEYVELHAVLLAAREHQHIARTTEGGWRRPGVPDGVSAGGDGWGGAGGLERRRGVSCWSNDLS